MTLKLKWDIFIADDELYVRCINYDSVIDILYIIYYI